MILKINSTGQDVKELQDFLGILADGHFGPVTKEAVFKWQTQNGLRTDGIVGPATWDAMGLASTDESEKTYITNNGLPITRHFLPHGEYKDGPVKPEYVFIHHTAGWHNPYKTIDDWGKDTRGAVATEFVLGGPSVRGNDDSYDGLIVQAFPEGNYGWHLGKNGSQVMHKNSVTMELCNFGYIKDGKTYAGTIVDKSQIVTLAKPFKGYKDWHRYSDAQIESLRLWMHFIAERNNIDIRAGLPTLIKQKGAAAFEFNENAYYGKVKGVLTHTNIRKDKYDMFPQQELMDMLVSL
jgi:hypothetical protein